MNTNEPYVMGEIEASTIYGSVYDLYVNEKTAAPLSAHTVRRLIAAFELLRNTIPREDTATGTSPGRKGAYAEEDDRAARRGN